MIYNFYDLVVSNKTDSVKLTYKLESYNPAQVWAKLIRDCSPSNLRKSLSPWRGVVKNWDEKILELNNLITDLNKWIDTPIKDYWDDNEPHQSLNRLHIHFPEEEKKTVDPVKRKQLSRYNDLIHEISGLLISKSRKKEFMHLLLCPEDSLKVDILEEDYKYFTPNYKFGDLKIHYCHVGRHPLELFLNKDVNCPKDQIKPQSSISAYHTLSFFDAEIPMSAFNDFYNTSGLQWPYELGNPQLAIGYINAGKLIYVNDRTEFCKQAVYDTVKSCDEVTNWKIY